MWIGAVACGTSQPGQRLDCAWLAAANCWKTIAAAAESCVPAAGTHGTLSADAMTCTYGDGHVVTSTQALTASHGSPPFTLTTNGQTCMSYGPGMLSTQAGTVLLAGDEVNGMVTSVTLTCPDGSQVTGDFQALLACRGDAGFAIIPGSTIAGGPSEITFALDGTDQGSLPIWDCRTP
jgi:hypothetical protein